MAAAFVTALPDSAVTCVLGHPDCRRHSFHFDLPPQFRGFLARARSARPGRAGRPLQADGLCSYAKLEGHWPLGSATRSIALTRPAMAVLTPPCWRPLEPWAPCPRRAIHQASPASAPPASAPLRLSLGPLAPAARSTSFASFGAPLQALASSDSMFGHCGNQRRGNVARTPMFGHCGNQLRAMWHTCPFLATVETS